MFVTTASGRHVDLLNPQPEQIDLADIAQSLSRIEHFNGHLRAEGYSVGLHSVDVANYLYETFQNKPMALQGLMHDGHEFVTGDIPRPVKRLIDTNGELERLQRRLDAVIFERFGVDSPLHEAVHEVDNRFIVSEASLMGGWDVSDWHERGSKALPERAISNPNDHTAREVADIFLERFDFYGGRR